MPDVVVTVVGLDELQRAFRATEREMTKAVHDGLAAAGQTVRVEAQRRVPYKTGKLSRAIRPGPVTGSGTSQSIRVGIAPGGGAPSGGPSGSRNPGMRNTGDPRVYGPVVEYGSGPHTIIPIHRRALRFEVGGTTVFARRVEHPGTRPHPFLVPALMDNIDLVNHRVQARVEAVLRGFGRTR